GRTKDKCVCDRKHRRRRTDADSEDQDSHNREPGMLPKRPTGRAAILPQPVQRPQSQRLATLVLDGGNPTNRAEGGPSRFGGSHAEPTVLLDQLVHVKSELCLEFVLDTGAPQKWSKPRDQKVPAHDSLARLSARPN